jgi:hypothetical protein
VHEVAPRDQISRQLKLSGHAVCPKLSKAFLCQGLSRNERLWNDRFWRIVLKKSFFADDEKFSGPLVRLSRCEVRDHMIYRKNGRRPSYRLYSRLQRQKSPMRHICEIFGTPRFRSFSTQPAQSGRSYANKVRDRYGKARKSISRESGSGRALNRCPERATLLTDNQVDCSPLTAQSRLTEIMRRKRPPMWADDGRFRRCRP